MKKSILIIDDEQAIRESLFMLLSEEGFDCETARDGKEGLEKAKNKRYDLIILDLIMPRLSGVGVTREIKRIQPDAKLLFITAYSDQEKLSTLANDPDPLILLKPIDFDELLELIQSCI